MQDTRFSRQGWIILFGVPALFFIAYLLFLTPHVLNLPICAVKLFLGIDCPGCGLCHSIVFLIHGKVRHSIDFHPLGIIIAGWLVFLFIRTLVGIFLGKTLRPLLSQRAVDLLLVAFLVGLFGQWLVKIVISIG
jgi:hypothetical protein